MYCKKDAHLLFRKFMVATILQFVISDDSCKENLKQLHVELSRLFTQKNIIHDARFLRRMAITVKHLYFDAKKTNEEKICRFLNSPLGSFMENRCSLLDAADAFSEQDPKHSDLGSLLEEIALFGPLFIRVPHALIDPSKLCL